MLNLITSLMVWPFIIAAAVLLGFVLGVAVYIMVIVTLVSEIYTFLTARVRRL